MNSFGNIFRVSIYGESHGAGVGVILDGVPPGIEISEEDLEKELSKRKSGAVGTTKRIEQDKAIFLSGIKQRYTTGAPINIFFENKNTDSKTYVDFVDLPRPGHADFASVKKYLGYNDLRGSGHFSGRLTVGIVAAGYIGKKILEKTSSKIDYKTDVMQLGEKSLETTEKNELENYILKIQEEGDSIGGVIRCEISNLPIGLGEPFFDSVESMISHGVFSIPGVKGIEFGAGFEGCKKKGSEFNDIFISEQGKTETNNNGGINGGITNGNSIVFNVAVKPTSSILKAQKTFNFKSKKIEEINIKGRHDVAFILRVPIIVESMAAIALADLLLREKK
ncbi:MAG: chorismate synthase [Fusobacteriaceae bacterium]|nr:chorismate synthase [Fusobacteriaceae bacterium]